MNVKNRVGEIIKKLAKSSDVELPSQTLIEIAAEAIRKEIERVGREYLAEIKERIENHKGAELTPMLLAKADGVKEFMRRLGI